MRVSFLLKTLLYAALAGTAIASLSACGGSKAGSKVALKFTPLPTLGVPEGPLPTRAADLASLCQKTDQKQWDSMPKSMLIDPKLSYTATIQTEKGNITIKLLLDIAPWTVNNFVFLACSGFYDNLTFQAVALEAQPPGVPHPYVQAGDPLGRGYINPKKGGPGYLIPAELSDHPFTTGTVGMVSQAAGMPPGGSQFFIVLEDSPELLRKLTAFGEVTSGLDVLRKLTPRDPSEHGPPGDKILQITIQESPSP